jgi:hypothetical protein
MMRLRIEENAPGARGKIACQKYFREIVHVIVAGHRFDTANLLFLGQLEEHRLRRYQRSVSILEMA